MANKGVITGDQVFKGVLERAKEINAEFEKLVKTFTKMEASLKGSKGLKELIQTEKQYIQIQKELERLEREKIRNAKEVEKVKTQQARTEAVLNRDRERSAQFAQKQAAAAERERQKVAKLNSAYSQASKQLNQLRQKYKDLATRKAQGEKLTKKEIASMKQYRGEALKLDRQLKKIDASVGQYQRSVGNYSKALGGLFKGFSSFLGAFGVTTGIFAFAAVLKDTFRIVKEFDQAQADLAAILGKSKKEIGALTDQAKELGATTAFTAIQVSNLQLELSKLGFNEGEILDATKGVEDFAIATGVEAARAAKLAGAAIRGFGLNAAEAGRVASTLAVSTTRSASSFQTLEISLPKVAALANGLNFNLEETTALLGTLQNAGFEASISGTSLRQVFAELADESGGLQQALGGEIRNFDDFVNGLENLQQQGISLNEILQLVPVRAAAALKVLIQNNKDIKELNQELKDTNGELAKLAKTKLDSIEGDLILARSAWEGFVQSLEDGEGPIGRILRFVIQSITELLNLLREAELTGDEREGQAQRRAATKAFENEYQFLKEDAEIQGKDVKVIAEGLEEGYKKAVAIAKANLKGADLKLRDAEAAKKAAEQDLSATYFDLEPTRKAWEEAQNQVIYYAAELGNAEGKLKAVNLALGNVVTTQGEMEEGTVNSINNLKKQLEEIEAQRDSVDIASPEFQLLTAEANRLKEFIKSLTEAQETAVEGSIKWYEIEIKKLKKQQEEVEITSRKYGQLAFQIENMQNQLELEKAAGGKVKAKVNRGLAGDIFEKSARENAKERLESETKDRIKEFEKEVEMRKKIQKNWEKFVKDSEESIRENVRQTFESFANYYGVDMSAFSGLMEGKTDDIESWRTAVQESTVFVTNLALDSMERELQAKRATLDQILNAESSSEEQKKIAREKFEKEEAELRKKQFKAEQDALTFQVAIDTAAAVAKILLQAGIFAAGGPLTAALAANAFTQAGIAAAMGAAQIALIRSQKVPEFFQGKDKWNNFEGVATWGERRPEVLIDKDGNLSVSPNQRTPLFVKQDDIIVPSLAQFDREMASPNSDVHRRVIGNLKDETRERLVVNNQVDLSGLRGLLQEEIRRGFKGVNINVNNSFGKNHRYDRY